MYLKLKTNKAKHFAPRQEETAIYFLFARLFREAPTKDFLRTLNDPTWIEKSEQIAVEFASLFLVAGEKIIPPYESYYCDTLTIDASTACSPYFVPEPFPEGGLKGFLCGPSAQSVQNIYETFGFELNPSFHDLPDHVSVELEFMGRLHELGKTNDAHQFFQEHLGRWVGFFLDKMTTQKVSDFYQVVALSLKEFLTTIPSHPTTAVAPAPRLCV